MSCAGDSAPDLHTIKALQGLVSDCMGGGGRRDLLDPPSGFLKHTHQNCVFPPERKQTTFNLPLFSSETTYTTKLKFLLINARSDRTLLSIDGNQNISTSVCRQQPPQLTARVAVTVPCPNHTRNCSRLLVIRPRSHFLLAFVGTPSPQCRTRVMSVHKLGLDRTFCQ